MRTRGIIKAEKLAKVKALREEIDAIKTPEPPKIPAVGRHPVITKEVLRKLQAAFSYGCPDDEACAYAGISTSTFYAYQADHPEMLELKQHLRRMPTIKARSAVVTSFKTRPELALRYLEDTIPDEFNPKTTVKHEGALEINFSQELKERTKKYEPKPITNETNPPEIPPSDVGSLEG